MTDLDDAAVLAGLARDAERDGHGMVTHLMTEWTDGTNRYTKPGERLYVARMQSDVVGVCGLNIDPYVDDERIGRVRRLYVAVDERRHGIGSILVRRIVEDARRSFDRLRLRTRNPVAATFYEAQGFERVVGDDVCTHELVFVGEPHE